MMEKLRQVWRRLYHRLSQRNTLGIIAISVAGIPTVGTSVVLAIAIAQSFPPEPSSSAVQQPSPTHSFASPVDLWSPPALPSVLSTTPAPLPSTIASPFSPRSIARETLPASRPSLLGLNHRDLPAIAAIPALGSQLTSPVLPRSLTLQAQLPPAPPSPATTDAQTLNLTLSDVVVLVLQNNRAVKNAYLQRILDRRDLELVESKFSPLFTPEIRIAYDRNYFDTTTERGRAIATVGGNLLLPTGTRISVNLVGESFGDSLSSNTLRQGFNAIITQPLLREYGVDVNTASVQSARIQEQANVLNLKVILIDTITRAIRAYRDLLLAQEQLKIQQRSLAQAKLQLADTEVFVELGKRPRADIVQAQTGVAQREVAVAAARNNLGQAQLNLLRVLNLEQTLVPVAVELPQVQQASPLAADPLIQTALAKNPGYLQATLAIEQGKLNLLLAQNRSQWNLNLEASLGNTLRTNVTGQVDVGAAIVLSRTFGDLSLEQATERSQIQLQRLENNQLETQENLTVEVRNSVRAVNDNYQQLLLARQARELAAQQLENERQKYRLGLSGTRQIDVLRIEDDLASAQNTELNAAIAYLNALTQLEQLTGTTLDTWKITLEGS